MNMQLGGSIDLSDARWVDGVLVWESDPNPTDIRASLSAAVGKVSIRPGWDENEALKI